MSLSRFHSETADNLGPYCAPSYQKDVLRAQGNIRDKWLAASQYQAVVAAILGNWTSGNCVDFMLPVSEALLTAGEYELHHHLWARTVKRQVDDAFRSYSYIRKAKRTFDEISAIDTAHFDEFDIHAYDDRDAATSFLLNRLVRSLGQWRQGLQSHRMSTDEVDNIENDIKALRKPKIQVRRESPTSHDS